MASTLPFLQTVLPENVRTHLPTAHEMQLGWVNTDLLKIDPDYQRRIDMRDVKTYADEWDSRLAGSLLVSLREHGDLVVFDGQTRLASARMAHVPLVHCLICLGLDQAQEAKLFVKTNTQRRAVHVIERFNAAVVARNPNAIGIKTILERNGFKVDFKGPNTIAAVLALEYAYAWKVLDPAISIVRHAWPGKVAARSAVIFLGVAAFDYTYQDAYDEGILVQALRDEVPPAALKRDALMGMIDPSSYTGHASWAAVASEMRIEYNRHVRHGKLPKFVQPELPRSAVSVAKAKRA